MRSDLEGSDDEEELPVFPDVVSQQHDAVASSKAMKDFSNAAFAPEVIEVMTTALERAVATLPEPVHSHYVSVLAESILRTANNGERDPSVLSRIALIELRLEQRR